jgi:hypothetical protein
MGAAKTSFGPRRRCAGADLKCLYCDTGTYEFERISPWEPRDRDTGRNDIEAAPCADGTRGWDATLHSRRIRNTSESWANILSRTRFDILVQAEEVVWIVCCLNLLQAPVVFSERFGDSVAIITI